MKKYLKNKEPKIVFILTIIAFTAVLMLITNIVSTRKSLDKIIYDAKVEAEKTLISSGLAVYTKDIEGKSVNSLTDENLPENTVENQQEKGTIVAPKENWNIETVTAISVGNGETIPVPKGFYYVGGDIDTGVIISDEEEDKYNGQTDKTTWEYTTNLKGNQFVWIPCTEEEYVKNELWDGKTQTPTTLANSGWDKTTYSSELPQIRKYGGFYVARYEAGLAKTINEFTSVQQNTSQVYNIEGIPQSKATQIPWSFIDWTTSQKNAQSMYNTDSVSSGLITGTQWDTILNQMVKKSDLTESDLVSSEKWGNYLNNSIEYKGRLSKIYYSSGKWYVPAFGGETEGKTNIYSDNTYGDLITTGASKQTEKYHIFDMAGNVWEWTDETSLYKQGNANETNSQHRLLRGGYCFIPYNTYPACYRYGLLKTNITNVIIGFRVVLYIK